jgi:hypothetical protein
MDLHPDFSDLLAEFARFEVRYALIGGYAVGLYTKPRATKDRAGHVARRPPRQQARVGAPAGSRRRVRARKRAVDIRTTNSEPPFERLAVM